MDYTRKAYRNKKKIREPKRNDKVSKRKEEILKILAEAEAEHDIEKDIAENIALVEYYYGVYITGDYPIMKRFNQQETLAKAFDTDARRFGLKSDG